MPPKIEEQGFWYQIPKEIVDSGNLVKAVLYGVIASVARTSGVCFATNKYLLEKIGRKDNEVISQNLTELVNDGWLVVEYVKDTRHIYLGPLAEKLRVGLRKKPHTSTDETADIPTEKTAHNKISIKQTNLTRGNTPGEIAKEFFELPERQNQIVEMLVAKGAPQQMAEFEVKKFIGYWTELNKSGKKQRWETEKFFELNRRLATWFRNKINWDNQKVPEKKGITI